MAYNDSSIDSFKEFAQKKWPFYFENAKCLRKKEWDALKRKEAGLPEPTQFEIEVSARAQYAVFNTHIFVLEKPIMFYVVEDAFRKEKEAIRIFNIIMDFSEASGRKALYTIDFKYGMYLIFLNSNTSGNISEIFVDVYYSYDEFTSSISNYWTEMNNESSFSVRNLIDITQLANMCATQ